MCDCLPLSNQWPFGAQRLKPMSHASVKQVMRLAWASTGMAGLRKAVNVTIYMYESACCLH